MSIGDIEIILINGERIIMCRIVVEVMPTY